MRSERLKTRLFALDEERNIRDSCNDVMQWSLPALQANERRMQQKCFPERFEKQTEPEKDNASLLECYTLYQNIGLTVIPAIYKTKRPAVKFQSLFDRLPTVEEEAAIECLLKNRQPHNLAVICGVRNSEGLYHVAIDVDKREELEPLLEEHPELKDTMIDETPHGAHIHIYSRKFVQTYTTSKGLPHKVEILGHGHLVTMPPSVNEEGIGYKFYNNERRIKVFDDFEALITRWFAEDKTEKELPDAKPCEPQDWASDILGGVSEGERDNTCIRLAGHYKAKGLKYEETFTLCLNWAEKCQPPFPDREVEKCVKSAYGYQEKEAQNQAETLTFAKEVALKWLKLKDTNIIDVALATIIANKAEGDPVWLLLVGAPSTGKSEILRGLFDCSGIHPLGGFTANTFASGFEKVSVGLLETLPKEITLIVKDFGTLLSMRHEDKAMVLQQLREIYDGEYKKEYGNGRVVHWKGRMGLLGAATSAIENYHSVIGELGNRYMLYRCESGEVCRGDIAVMALNDEGAEQRMREEITNAFKQAVDNTPKASLVAIPQEIKARLAILADLASRLRSPVSRNPYDKTVNYQPDIEGPARLVKAFGKLGKGLSAVRGKLEMTDQEYEVIKTVATDTAPKGRMEIVRYLLNRQWHRTKDIASYLDMPQTTATRELEDLMMIKVLERRPDLEGEKELGQTTPYRWQLRGEIANLITKAGLFEADD